VSDDPTARLPAIEAETDKVIPTLTAQIERDYAPPRVKRDAHPKPHGVVQATVDVPLDIPAELQHGVFQPGAHYPAWIRFSNAFGIEHDLEWATRGMGIKLLGVAGHKLAPDEQHTQDFLLATHDAFFLPNELDYHEFVKAAGADPSAVISFFTKRGMWRPLLQLLRSSLVIARNPLAIPYFSQTPYRLGSTHVVKLQAKPQMTPALAASLPSLWWFWFVWMGANVYLQRHSRKSQKAQAEASVDAAVMSRDFLRIAMMSFLAEHGAAFDLQVQTQCDKKSMPLDDPTVRWSQRRSPFQHVATLTIPRQSFWPDAAHPPALKHATMEMMELGENMSFHPWHALAEHEPLGAINIMRRRIYPAIVQRRHGLNGVAPIEPDVTTFNRLKRIVQP
jgi:hypothetical protein